RARGRRRASRSEAARPASPLGATSATVSPGPARPKKEEVRRDLASLDGAWAFSADNDHPFMTRSRMIRHFAFLAALLLAASSTRAADVPKETLLLRFPDIHEDRVVFSYGGDLWIAPVRESELVSARRLTSHPGLELFPRFSPDGKWIAFTGQYDGDEQVYVVPADGGE